MKNLNDSLNEYYSDIDKNKIRDRIFSELDFPPEEIDNYSLRPVPRKKNNILPVLSAAAVMIVIFAVSRVMGNNEKMYGSLSASTEANDIYTESENEFPEEDTKASDELFFPSSDGWDYSRVSVSAARSYNYSDFDGSVSPAFEENRSDDFFVEAEVLENTDFFLDCTVNEISEVSEDGITVSVSPIHVICPEDMTLPAEMSVHTSRAYVMTEGHEYLLPIKELDGEYFTSDSSSPKIMLSDGYVLYQNGWQSLSGGGEQYLQKDIASSDDFFYDRMLITAEASLQGLFDKFYEIKYENG